MNLHPYDTTPSSKHRQNRKDSNYISKGHRKVKLWTCTVWLGYTETCLGGNTNIYLVLAEPQIQELATTASVHHPMEVLPGPKDTHPVVQKVGKAFGGMSVRMLAQ